MTKINLICRILVVALFCCTSSGSIAAPLSPPNTEPPKYSSNSDLVNQEDAPAISVGAELQIKALASDLFFLIVEKTSSFDRETGTIGHAVKRKLKIKNILYDILDNKVLVLIPEGNQDGIPSPDIRLKFGSYNTAQTFKETFKTSTISLTLIGERSSSATSKELISLRVLPTDELEYSFLNDSRNTFKSDLDLSFKLNDQMEEFKSFLQDVQIQVNKKHGLFFSPENTKKKLANKIGKMTPQNQDYRDLSIKMYALNEKHFSQLTKQEFDLINTVDSFEDGTEKNGSIGYSFGPDESKAALKTLRVMDSHFLIISNCESHSLLGAGSIVESQGDSFSSRYINVIGRRVKVISNTNRTTQAAPVDCVGTAIDGYLVSVE